MEDLQRGDVWGCLGCVRKPVLGVGERKSRGWEVVRYPGGGGGGGLERKEAWRNALQVLRAGRTRLGSIPVHLSFGG